MVLAAAPFGVSLRQTPATAIYLMTLLTVGVWFATGCAYAYVFQRRLGFERRVAAAVAALTGVATLALPYAIVLTNHVPCGAAGLAGCYHLVRARDGGASARGACRIVLRARVRVRRRGDSARGRGRRAAVGTARAPVAHRDRCGRTGRRAADGVQRARVGQHPADRVHRQRVDDGADPAGRHRNRSRSFCTPPPITRSPQLHVLVGGKGLLSYTPLVLVAAYGLAVMWRTGGVLRRLATAIVAATALFVVTIVTLQIQDAQAQNFGERRYVDLFFMLCVALGPALVSVRSRLAAAAVRACVVISVAIAALGTVAPFGGERGEAGFSFASASFGALYQRSPVQAALDVLLLLAVVAFVVRLVPFPLVTRAAPRRA